MSATHGQCAKCGDSNPYTGIVCSGCGSRLPWADASTTARRMASNTNLLSTAPTNTTRSGTVTPIAHPAPSTAPHQVFCNHCGTANASGLFCSRCGQTLAISPAEPTYTHSSQSTYYPPHGAPIQNNVNVVVSQKSNNSGWFAAICVLLFATPLGCIMIPLALVVLAYAVYGLPFLIGVAAAMMISKSSLDQDQKNWLSAAAVMGGCVFTAILWAALKPY